MAVQNGNGTGHLSAVQKLRRMLADGDKLIVCPGVYDGYTARIALQEGAECLYMVLFPSFQKILDSKLTSI